MSCTRFLLLVKFPLRASHTALHRGNSILIPHYVPSLRVGLSRNGSQRRGFRLLQQGLEFRLVGRQPVVAAHKQGIHFASRRPAQRLELLTHWRHLRTQSSGQFSARFEASTTPFV